MNDSKKKTERNLMKKENCFTPEHVRPTAQKNNEISFAWQNHVAIIEPIYDSTSGLRLAVYANGSVSYVTQYEGFKPMPLLRDYVSSKTLRLPSKAEPYGTRYGLLQEMEDFISRYFDCTDDFCRVAALWCQMTWLYEVCHACPYLRFTGPPASGKSRGTEVVAVISNRPVVVSGSATPPNMFRMIELLGGTLIVDEADFASGTGIGNEISKILNQGYEQGKPVMRTWLDPATNEYIPRAYEVFCPKVVTGRQQFQDDAVETRALVYRPVQTNRTDIPKLLTQAFYDEALAIRNKALMFRFENLEIFQPREAHLPKLRNRTNQIILAMLTLAQDADAERVADGLEPVYEAALIRFAEAQDRASENALQGTPEALLVEEFVKWTSPQRPRVADLTDRVVDRAKLDDPKIQLYLTPKRVGQILRELDFDVTHTRRGNEVTIEPDRLASHVKKYGLALAGEGVNDVNDLEGDAPLSNEEVH